MVQLTSALLLRVKQPGNKWWKRQRVFQYTGHFYGRRRNVHSIALRSLFKAWENAQDSRRYMKTALTNLWSSRIDASCRELGLKYYPFVHALARSNIALDRKVLADLAWSEPRTFRGLADIAMSELAKDPAHGINSPDNVIADPHGSNKSFK